MNQSLASLVLLLIFLTVPSVGVSETGPGIVIYTSGSNGRDEVAFAVPFVKLEQFELVTLATTKEGKVLRVMRDQLKQIVRPIDLSHATAVDDAGLQALRTEADEIRSMQARFPLTTGALDPHALEIERMLQVIESGNVLVRGRLVPAADYAKEAAAARGKSIDINLGGRNYTKAKLSSVTEDKVSIMHSGGVASLAIDQLSDDQVSQLNETSNSVVIERMSNYSAP